MSVGFLHMRFIIGFFIVASFVMIQPVSPRAETVEEAIEAALNFHPTVKAAIANRDAEIEARKENLSEFFPKIDVRGTGGREFSNNSTSRGLNTTRGEGYSWLWDGTITMSQMLFDGFETSNRVDAAHARRVSANYNITDIREALALRTIFAYLDVMRANETLGNLQKHSKVVDDYIRRIEIMVNEGAADVTMLVKAKDIEVQLKDTLASTEGEKRTVEAQYKEIVGRAPGFPMHRPQILDGLIFADIEEAVDYAVQNHPALHVASQNANALEHEAMAEHSFWYPDLTGELSYQEKDLDDVIGGEVRDAKAVLKMNWNISVGGGQIAREKKAKKRHFESLAQKSALKGEIERDVRAAWAEMNAVREQNKLAMERVELNEQLFKASKSQFEGARIDLLALLQSDNALFNAKMGWINSKYRNLASVYAYLASAGKLQSILNVVENDSSAMISDDKHSK
jgi:adhesin transport system outer membrane protein